MKQTLDKFIAIDIETTGLSPLRGDRVLEVGAVAIERGHLLDEFHSLIKVERGISTDARKVHGITSEMLKYQPRASEVFPQLRKFMGDGILVAHNARFDLGFLRHEFGRLGLGFNHRHVCTLKTCKTIFPDLKDYKLGTVYQYLFGNLPEGLSLHRALDDARLVSKIWLELLKKKTEWD